MDHRNAREAMSPYPSDDAGLGPKPGPKPLRAAIAEALSNGEAWRFKDLATQLRTHGTESEIYKELRALIRGGAVRRVRHGVYLAAGPYDWSAPIEAEAGVPVIQSAIYSQLHRLRTVDELRTVLGLPREVVWRSLRALIQSGAVCTGEPLGVFREMTFIRRDLASAGAAPSAGGEEELDRTVLACVSAGPLYSAHAVAVHTDILVRTVKLTLRKLSTLGLIRCFAFDDGLYFYLTSDKGHGDGRLVKPVDVYAELGAVNMATLGVIAAADEGVTAAQIDRQLEEVFRGTRNTAARIITKLRRSGLVQMRDTASPAGSLWETTDIGADVVAIAQADPVATGAATPPASEVRYALGSDDDDLSAHRRLAQWILDTIVARDGTVRRRIPINKRILARSLNVTRAHLDKCLRLLAPAGVTLDGWDLVVTDIDALRTVLQD